MFCPQCGTQVVNEFQYCPVCGARLDHPIPLSSIDQNNTKRVMPLWFKILVFLAVVALLGVTAGILFTESLVDVVDKQLADLKEGDIAKAYYDYTSTNFQASTSLDQFKEFVSAYPIFLNVQSASFTQRSMRQNIGTLKGTLTTQEHLSLPIEYKLIKEDGKWRILSIRLLQKGGKENEPAVDPQQLIQVAKSQMQAIEKGQIDLAYQLYTSKEFKTATSEKEFESFLNKYPILAQHQTVTLHKPVFKNGFYTLSAILQAHQWSAYVKYYLTEEDGEWKISSMRILSTMEGEQEEEAEAHPASSENLENHSL